MSSGRVHMKFSAEISQANAQIGKLNAQLRKQQKTLDQLRDASRQSNEKQQSGLVNLTRNISAAAIAYQAMNRAISLGNELLDKRNMLQDEALDFATRIGPAQSQFMYQLGAISDKGAEQLMDHVMRTAKVAGYDPARALKFAGDVASAIGGDPKFGTEAALIEGVKGIVTQGLPVARAFPGGGSQVGMLMGDLTTLGFTPEQARAHMIATQRVVHSPDLPAQSYIMRSLVGGRLLQMDEFKTMSDAEKRETIQEMTAITAGFTQFMKSKGMEMPSTAAAGAMITLYERYGDILKGKSPLEALDWMTQTGVWQELDLKDVRGESIAKPGTLDLFRGGELRGIVDNILTIIKDTTVEEADKIVRRADEGVGKWTQSQVFRQDEQRKAADTINRSLGDGIQASWKSQMESFENEFTDTAAERFGAWVGGWPEYFAGAPEDFDTQRMRSLSRARKLAYGRAFPWRSVLMPDVPFNMFDPGGLATRTFGSTREMLRRWEAGERDLPMFQEFTESEIETFRRLMDNIDANEARAESTAKETANPINAENSSKEQTRVMKATVEQSGSIHQRGRQTEPD